MIQEKLKRTARSLATTLEKMLVVISNAEEGIKKLQKFIGLGFTEIVLTNSSPERYRLVKLIAEKITPNFK
jgi:hypothetical protein